MKILYIAAECKPFSKVGGVGDVAGELPIALKKKGIDIEIVTPLYEDQHSHLFLELLEPLKQEEYTVNFNDKKGIPRKESVSIYRREADQSFSVPVNFVRNAAWFKGHYGQPYINSENLPYYDDILRFSFFSEACLQLIKEREPDIIHINDWVLGYLFGRMQMEKLPQKRILTVHNIGYQGNIGRQSIKGWQIEKILKHPEVGPLFLDPRKEWVSVNPLRLAMELADMVNTVSPTYKEEMLAKEEQKRFFEGAKGLHSVTKSLKKKNKLIGILNGFEYNFDPSDSLFKSMLKDKKRMKIALSQDFTDPDGFLLGFVGRAVEQKFKLLTEKIEINGKFKSVLEHIIDIPGLNLAVVASGEFQYEELLQTLKERENCSITIAFDPQKAKQISLGSDVFLMPSLFEPCGITQMASLAYATPPLVRWTGGLVDTVEHYKNKDSNFNKDGTGFGFDGFSRGEILTNLIQCVKDVKTFYTNNKKEFKELQKNGYKKRFLWETAAENYIEKLYKP